MNVGLRSGAKLLLHPLKPIIEQEFHRQIQQRTSLIPIENCRPEDIFLVGYPKSGNTWLQHLVAGLLYGMDMRLVPDSIVQDLVPEVHASNYYRRHRPSTFFVSHALPQPEYRNVVYLLRDGRDAMVSYFHHLTAVHGRAPDFHKLVSTGQGLFPSHWHEHVEAWLANPYGAQMLLVKYEDLKRDTVAELRRLCQFAGLARDQGCLEAVARASSFEEMREKEKKFGWDARGQWPKDKSFVRRGTVRSFEDEMPRSVLEAFMQHSAGALRLAGYSEEDEATE